MTKQELVKEIFMAATNGKRDISNFPEGMYLMEMMAANNYAWAIRNWYDQWKSGEKTIGEVFSQMAEMTITNTEGVNGMTGRSKSVMQAYWRFV